jgi:hypothetical protein
MSEFGSRRMRGGRMPLSTPAKDIARRETATTEGSVPRLKRSSPLSLLSGNCCFTALSPVVPLHQRQAALSQKPSSSLPKGVAALRGRVFIPTRSGRDSRASSVGSALATCRGTHDPWHQPGVVGFLAKRIVAVPGVRSCWRTSSETEVPAQHVSSTNVAALPGGALLPAPPGPHQQGPPHGSALGSKQEPSGSWQYGGTPLDSSARALGLTPVSVVHPIEVNRSNT